MMKQMTPMMTSSFIIFCFASVTYVSLLRFVYLMIDFLTNMLTNKNAVFCFFPPQTLFSGKYGFPDVCHGFTHSCLLLVPL